MKKWISVFENHLLRSSFQERKQTIHNTIIPFLQKKSVVATTTTSDTTPAEKHQLISKDDLKGVMQEVVLRSADFMGDTDARKSQKLICHDLYYQFILQKQILSHTDASKEEQIEAIEFCLQSILKEADSRIKRCLSGYASQFSSFQTLLFLLAYTLKAVQEHPISVNSNLLVETQVQMLRLHSLSIVKYYDNQLWGYMQETKAYRLTTKVLFSKSTKEEDFAALMNVLESRFLRVEQEHGVITLISMQFILEELQKKSLLVAGPFMDRFLSILSEAIIKCSSATDVNNPIYSKTTPHTFALLSNLYSILNEKQLESVESQLEKGLKRSKSTISPIFAHFIRQLPSNTSLTILESAIPFATDCFQSKNQMDRKNASEVVTALVQKLHAHPKILVTLFEHFKRLLLQGGLSLAEKVDALACIGSLSTITLDGSAAQDDSLKRTIISALESIINTVSESDRVRVEAIGSLIKWLSRDSGAFFGNVPESCSKTLETAAFEISSVKKVEEGIEEDFLRKRAIKAIGDLCQIQSFAEQLLTKTLLDKLVDVVNKSEQKLVDRLAAVYSARALVLGEYSNPKLRDELVNKRKILVKLSHLLNYDLTLHKLTSAEDFLVLGQLCAYLLLTHYSDLVQQLNAKKPNPQANIINAVYFCLSFALFQQTNFDFRQILMNLLKQATETVSKSLMADIFQNGTIKAVEFLFKLTQDKVQKLNKESDTYNDDKKNLEKQYGRYGNSFFELAPYASSQENATGFVQTILPDLMLYFHHPLFYTYKTKNYFLKYWKRQQKQDNLDELVVQQLPTLLQSVITRAEEIGANAYGGYTLATLAELFVVSLFSKQQRPPVVEDHLLAIEQQHAVKRCRIACHSLLEELGKLIHANYINLSKEHTSEDFDVYAHVQSQKSKDADNKTSMHDVDIEMLKNPLFRQGGSTKADLSKYSLTDDEWATILQKEKDVKAKQKQGKALDLNTIRRQLVEKQLVQKEEDVVAEMQATIDQIILYLGFIRQVFSQVLQSQSTSPATPMFRHIFLAYISYVVFSISDLFTMKLKNIRTNALETYHIVSYAAKNVLEKGVLDMTVRCTYRLKAGVYDETRVIGADDDVVFAEEVISKLRLATMKKLIEPELFSIIVPFFEGVLNRSTHTIQQRKQTRKQFAQSSLAQCLSILSSHAGLEGLRSGTTRPRVAAVLVECLSYFPVLYRQAHNALLSFAKNLQLEDLDPILESLLSSQPNVRATALKALQFYAPISGYNNNVSEETNQEAAKLKNGTVESGSLQKLVVLLFVATFDDDEENAGLAKPLWTRLDQSILQSETKNGNWKDIVIEKLFERIETQDDFQRETICRSLAGILHFYNEKTGYVLSKLYTMYDAIRVDEENEAKSTAELAASKLSIATAVETLAPLVDSPDLLRQLFEFIQDRALWDDDQKFQDALVKAALVLVNAQGASHQELLLGVFKKFLSQRKNLKKNPKTSTQQMLTAKQQEELAAKAEQEQIQEDYIVGSVVVFMGTLARFFKQDDDRLKEVIEDLLNTLLVQSNSVQKSVSITLSPIIAKLDLNDDKSMISDLIDRILNKLLESVSYGEKRGYAYGLAGILCGLKLQSLKEYKILNRMYNIFKTTKSTHAKEGVLLGFELLSTRLGTLLEPYLSTHILPLVLDAFSEQNIREYASDCANVLMKETLSGHGVRQILPQILQSVQIDSVKSANAWRIKTSSIQVLGAMAFCAPRQLGESLPKIMPVLTEALNDTHPEVAKASFKALERVGGVCQNPEISQQVPDLLTLLKSMDNKNMLEKVLENLLYTRFIHSIDAASLALMVPILKRGLKERSTNVKQSSAQIIGSMTALCNDSRDIYPYVNDIIPPLQQILIDPNPKVRASAAKAVGSLAKAIGEDRMEELINWLYSNLERKDTSANINQVERSGSAQGLCEIIAAQGVQRLQAVFPTILEKISEDQPAYIRQGYMELFVYLPALMKSQFEPFLPECLPKIISGLSEEEYEGLRETALSSCRVIVELYVSNAASISLLLPALMEGMESDEDKQRYNSLVLLHEFLNKISEVHSNETGKVKLVVEKRKKKKHAQEEDEGSDSDDEMGDLDDGEEGEGKEESKIAFEEVAMIDMESLKGYVKNDDLIYQMLSLLFILQNDVTNNVRSEARKIWRGLVHRPLAIMRQILPTLLAAIKHHLSLDNEEQREMGAVALGEVVVKLGEQVLTDIVPSLEAGLQDEDASDESKRGVLIGMKYLLKASTDKMLVTYQKTLLDFIKIAICDEDEEVREYAADCFDTLFKAVGGLIVNEILKELMKDLNEQSLSGLQQLILVRPQNFLPKLIPTLLGDEKSLSEQNARILGAVVEVSGSSLEPYVPKLIEVLIRQAGQAETLSEDLYKCIKYTVQGVDFENLFMLVEIFSAALSSNLGEIRKGATVCLKIFFDEYFNTGEEKIQPLDEEQVEFLSDKVLPRLIESILRLYMDPEEIVLKEAVKAIQSLFSASPSGFIRTKDEAANYIQLARDTIKQITEDSNGNIIIEQVPAFNTVPKGLDSLADLFLHGLMFGKAPQIREISALGLGDLIARATEKALKPSVVKITGPLIRIVGDRYGWEIKSAILSTMILLLEKGGDSLKPFLPQLQTTFVKSLQDPTVQVSKLSAKGLGKLVALLGNKVPALLTELHNSLKTYSQQRSKLLQTFNNDQQKNILVALVDACGSVLASTKTNKAVRDLFKASAVESIYETLIDLLHQTSESPFNFDEGCIQIRTVLADKAALTVSFFLEDASYVEEKVIKQEFLQAKTDALSNHTKVLLFDALIKELGVEKVSTMHWQELKQINLLSILSTKQHEQVVIASLKALSHVLNSDQMVESNKDLLPLIPQATSTSGMGDHTVKVTIVHAIKSVSKHVHNTVPLFGWVEPLLLLSKDKYVPVKLASERAFVYLLQLRMGTRTMEEYLDSASEKVQKDLRDYHQRILKKVAETDQSDDEL